MPKVTSKFQVTIPKRLADQYDIRPGSEIEWQAAGEFLRVVPPGCLHQRFSVDERRRMFEEGEARQRAREAGKEDPSSQSGSASRETPLPERGWRREDLYS